MLAHEPWLWLLGAILTLVVLAAGGVVLVLCSLPSPTVTRLLRRFRAKRAR
jgi:hypothetical protein